MFKLCICHVNFSLGAKFGKYVGGIALRIIVNVKLMMFLLY